MARAFVAELATSGITCNAISPGYFETKLPKSVLDIDAFQSYMKATVQCKYMVMRKN